MQIIGLGSPFTGLVNGVKRVGKTLGNEGPLCVPRELLKSIDAMSLEGSGKGQLMLDLGLHHSQQILTNITLMENSL